MPLTSNIASGLPPLATMFDASSAKRTLVSLSGSFRLKKMLAVMPPSTPTVAMPSDSAAPHRDLGAERDLVAVGPGRRVDVVEEEAVEQVERVARWQWSATRPSVS